MRLKRIDIFGFKSFCERTTVVFEPGITAVVGPNGCGKSNIADSILWVLGEQSPRTLRSDRMEDVIFNGSEHRRPLGMAEVSLTLEEVEPSPDNSLSRYREVCITRRLFRSGESEYLINKAPCRLKDIRDLLMDLGASFKGHGILEQGRVDELVTASPVERRTIIEETAGITKYKVRNAEAERKLEATEQNLQRVRDIIAEVKRQLNHLERQAKKAKTYQELREEIRSLELRLSVYEGRLLSGILENTQKEYSELQTKEAELLAQRSGQEAEIETLRMQAMEQQQGLENLKRSLHALESQILGAEHKVSALITQQKEWQDQAVHLEAETKLLDEALLEGQNRLEEQGRQTQALEEETAAHQLRLNEHEFQAQELELKIREANDVLEATRQQVFDHHGGMTQTRNKMTEGELRVAEIRRRMEKAVSQQAQFGEEQSKLQEMIRMQEEDLSARRQLLAQIRNELRQRQDRLETLQEDCKRQESSLAAHRQELQDKKIRHAMLLDQVQRHLNLQEGARELLTLRSPEQLDGFHGVLADLLETRSGYEKALEAILRERLSGLVMEGKSAITAALGVLKNQGAGEATFIPRHPRIQIPRQEALTRAETLKTNRRGVLGQGLSFVQAREDNQTLLDALLQDVLIVEDLALAFTLWEESAWTGTFVTLEGDVLESTGVLYGHSPRTEKKGLLQERRDMKTLEGEIGRIEQEVATLEQGHFSVTGQLKELSAQIEDHNHRFHALELEEVERVKKLEFLQQDLHRVEDNLELIRLEQQQAAQEEQEIRGKITQLSAVLEEEDRQRLALEASLQGQQGVLEQLATQKEARQAEMTQLKITLTGLQEKQANFRTQQEQLNRHLLDQREQLLSKRQRLEQLAARQQTSSLEKDELTQTIQRLSGERLSLINQIQVQTEAVSARQDRLKSLEGAHRLCQSELEGVQKGVRESEVRVAETRMRLDHIREVVHSLSHTALETAMQEMGEFELQDEEAKSRLGELKNKLEAMEPVNLAALDEHRELSERYEFLTRQEQDLTQSMEALHKAIAKVNQTIQSLFMETFEALNAKFGEVFTQFFEGGSARLVLLDSQNPLESGLDIVAQPPGKRLRHIQLLSGGEKALTAISLLFSSFLIHPGPFCVLDEIDAALDEENVRRFTRVLRSLTERSQFILITHNKRTMETADVLYGITMEERGSSKVISVKMAEMAGQSSG
jgi:chromosome segregation protein